MNLEQVGLQLGIAGILVVLGYKLARLLINRWGNAQGEQTKAWRETERERTLAISSGLTMIATSIHQHSSVDLASHVELAKSVNELGKTFARIEGRLEEAMSRKLTPIEGVPIVQAPADYSGWDADTQPSRPATKRHRTDPIGTPGYRPPAKPRRGGTEGGGA